MHMRYFIRVCYIALLATSTTLFVSPLYAKSAEATQVAEDYARYASWGRSDTQITISLYGTRGSARVLPNTVGTFSCLVSGLGIPDDKAHAFERIEQKGKLIHESTHCLVVPYTHTLPEDERDPLVRIANDLTMLMAESASDARAVIEIYRKDGISEANAYAAMLLVYRSKAKDVEHSTTLAVALARELVTYDSSRFQTDNDAFHTALTIARWSAESTIRRILSRNAHEEMMSSARVVATLRAMDKTVEDALSAFKNGRYENSAVTLRTNYEGRTLSDMHVFAGRDGGLRTESTLGVEHAHELLELRTLMLESKTPEEKLAVQALQKYGLLSKNNLEDTQTLFARWVKAFTHDAPLKHQAVCALIAKVIADTQEVENVGALYDKVTYELQRTFN